MVILVEYDPNFKKRIKKIKSQGEKNKLKKQIEKIIDNPSIGKPMRYERKGTRELYLKPFRLAYLYEEQEDKIVFYDIYHKDEQ